MKAENKSLQHINLHYIQAIQSNLWRLKLMELTTSYCWNTGDYNAESNVTFEPNFCNISRHRLCILYWSSTCTDFLMAILSAALSWASLLNVPLNFSTGRLPTTEIINTNKSALSILFGGVASGPAVSLSIIRVSTKEIAWDPAQSTDVLSDSETGYVTASWSTDGH